MNYLFNIAAGTNNIQSAFTVPTGGILNIESNVTNNSILNVNGSIAPGGAPLVNNGTINNNGVITSIDQNIFNNGTINNNGTLQGTMTISGNLNNPSGGTIAPGSSPGCITFNDDFSNDGVLNVEIWDGNACDDFDQIKVDGNTTVEGIINISFIGGSAPSTTTFPIVTSAGTLSGDPTINWPSGYMGTSSICSTCSPKEFRVSFSLLPVELTEFSIRATPENTTHLHWQTASETNNAGFELLKSNDARTWQPLTWVAGQGNSLEETHYEYIDAQPFGGENYYRLKQVDFDGTSTYSKVISIDFKTEDDWIEIYPNPNDGHFYLNLSNTVEHHIAARLIDSWGRVVWDGVLSTGLNEMGGHEALPSGVYFLRASYGNLQITKRLAVW